MEQLGVDEEVASILIQEGYRVEYSEADGLIPHDAGVGGE